MAQTYISSIVFIYLFLERERGRGGTDGEGERDSKADSTPNVEPGAGLSLTTLKTMA